MTELDLTTYTDVAPYREHPLLLHTRGWLHAQESLHTKRAYQRDVLGVGTTGEPAVMRSPAWLPWCVQNGLDPLQVTISHVNAYGNMLQQDGHSPSTRARKLSAVSSWYTYLVKAEVTERHPARDSGRPTVNRLVSPAVGLSDDELAAIFARATEDSPRSLAVVAVLYFGGFRVGSVLAANIGDLGWDKGDRTLRVVLKGAEITRDVIEDPAARALDAYLATRGELPATAPLILDPKGQRMNEAHAWRLVRRLAREASVKSWKQINPHTFRHAFTTNALDSGADLATVSSTLHHASIQTTLRYDRARGGRNRAGAVLANKFGHLVPSDESPDQKENTDG